MFFRIFVSYDFLDILVLRFFQFLALRILSEILAIRIFSVFSSYVISGFLDLILYPEFFALTFFFRFLALRLLEYLALRIF